MSVNRVILIGNLGKDPEVRTIETGVKVATFSLATSESYKNKNGERIEQTEWHNIVAWRGLAEIVEKFLKKGNTVYIEGKLKTRSYEDKDKIKRYTTEIFVDNLKMLGGKRDENNNVSTNNVATTAQSGIIENSPIDDELPF